MQRYFQKIWANYAIDKVLYVRKGVFMVRFANLQDKLAVVTKGCYHFDRKPLLVKGWNPDMDLQTETITSLPLWIQLPNLDIKYWGTRSLSEIGSILGIPLKTDKFTKERSYLHYARLLIDMPISGPFPAYVEFFNDAEVLIRQEVVYEWLPTKCDHCSMFGHTGDVCRHKVTARREWRPVTATGSANAPTEPHPARSAAALPSTSVHHFTQVQPTTSLPSTSVQHSRPTTRSCAQVNTSGLIEHDRFSKLVEEPPPDTGGALLF